MKFSLISSCILFFVQSSQAVVVATENPLNPRTDAPANGAPWSNVLITNSSASGVYLGGGWVLTAGHVFDDVTPAFVSFNGTNYFADSSLTFAIDNPSGGFSGKSDLILFRLNTAFDSLPTIETGSAAALTEITMIGFGGGKSWAKNNVELGGTEVIRYEGIDTFAFSSDYDSASTSEGQAITGDSGGGAFYLDGTSWKLAGIMLAVDNASTITYYADLSIYGDQINSIMQTNGPVPEPSALLLSLASACLLLRRRR